MTTFDMPASGTWEQRGGWVVRRLKGDAYLSLEQAAGLVGNLGYESIGFTTLQEKKPQVAGARGGFGWAQWTAGRRQKFEKWCSENGLHASSDEGNYGFLLHELMGDYKTFAARLRKTTTLEAACRLTHKEYETPSDVLDGSYRSGPDRLAWARRALAGAMLALLPLDDDTVLLGPRVGDPVEVAVRALQAALKVAVDGDPGPRTLAALANWRASR